KAADIAVQAGSRLYTDSASSYWAVKGYLHEYVNHTQKEYARGDTCMRTGRSACSPYSNPTCGCFVASAKPPCRGTWAFFNFLRNFRHLNAFEQAEFILQAALDPAIARRARRGEFVTCFDHFDLLQTAIN